MIDKIWKNGEIISYEDAKVGINTHSLHYGSSVFEGIRAYETPNGVGVLKLKEHMERFLYSMSVLGMKCKYSIDELSQAVLDIIKASGKKSCYIRPLAYYAEGGVSVLPAKDHPVDIAIYCIDMGKYMSADEVDIKVSKYIRIHPQSTVCDAKIGGHYVNSILASRETLDTHYHESLLLDVDGNVAEGAAMNVFFIKNNELITTPLGTILNGITRKLIIQIAKDLGYKVTERLFKVEELIDADEAFFCGTAAEVTPVASVDDNKLKSSDHTITNQIKEVFEKIKQGQAYKEILTYVEES
ncbi:MULTISPECIES: branched-chain amino acid transaminase [unclassified Francisella]|uniref:branched-chain amino acid transaminase n=1 Tax=unclassified Francisella TaxID=2610885 RepID=UPI002E328AA1|nr:MULTISPECIES: branched-chain amino acid transaminase [unclassified Francisella]MED7819150.1 branched-chain amino acid transaminase [Francisella sp. 19S2-4]MED7830377.1 branched-chain amino acid transaminase [Francisella sp. 19S2-10]